MIYVNRPKKTLDEEFAENSGGQALKTGLRVAIRLESTLIRWFL
jgi:hypothetical protein